MRLTPLDIRQQEFRRVMRGLDPDEVEQFLAAVATEFETLVAGNNDLRQRVLELEEKIVEYKNMEKGMHGALLAAEKLMGEAKESAQREAALIVREAELAAERAKTRLAHDLQRLQTELGELRRVKDGYLARVRWLLRSQLEQVEGQAQEFAEFDAGLEPRPHAPTPDPGFGAAVDRALVDSGPKKPAPWTPPGAVDSTAPLQPEWEEHPGMEWRPLSRPATRTPETSAPPGGLDDVLRTVGPDGTYDRPSPAPPSRPRSGEEIAQAARRAERLAAEARAAVERAGDRQHRPETDATGERLREGPGSRS
jgi:cell division initiation protein